MNPEDKAIQAAQPSPQVTPGQPDDKVKTLDDILRIAKEKGEQKRNASVSLDNMAKSAWKSSTGIREEIKKRLNVAYSIATGLTNKEVRKEVKDYISKVQPPTSTK